MTIVDPEQLSGLMLEKLAELFGVARAIALGRACEAIGSIAAARLAEIQAVREPAPPSMRREQD